MNSFNHNYCCTQHLFTSCNRKLLASNFNVNHACYEYFETVTVFIILSRVDNWKVFVNPIVEFVHTFNSLICLIRKLFSSCISLKCLRICLISNSLSEKKKKIRIMCNMFQCYMYIEVFPSVFVTMVAFIRELYEICLVITNKENEHK